MARSQLAERDGVTFMSKRERKRVRKSLVRGYVSNKVSDWKVGARDRAEFYRNLRHVKVARRQIATEMVGLAELVGQLRREIDRVYDRVPNVDTRYVGEAEALAKAADASVQGAAGDFYTFSRRRIWYTEAVR